MRIDTDFDVVIVGASFAGLATAIALCGHRVLLIDMAPIGAHQTSACGTTLATVQAVAAEAGIRAVHDRLVLHTGGHAIPYLLDTPYVTLDYPAFCRALWDQSDAHFHLARVKSMDAHRVVLADGEVVTADYVVNAAGWSGLRILETRVGQARGQTILGYGLETELPITWNEPGLHFYFHKSLVRDGYAWIFPCGPTTRFGVVSFRPGDRLRAVLTAFLDWWGLELGLTHGGVLPLAPLQGTQAGIFLVGDAAGFCLPVTGEGIRPAIVHSLVCGRLIAAGLAGALRPEEVRLRYDAHIRRYGPIYRQLRGLQWLIAHTPDPILACMGRMAAFRPLYRRLLAYYLRASGGLTPMMIELPGFLPSTPRVFTDKTSNNGVGKVKDIGSPFYQ